MGSFEDRRQSFENHFGYQLERDFKVTVCRARLLGLWVADQLGLSGDVARHYADRLVDLDFEERGPERVLQKATRDLLDRGIAISAHRFERQFDALTEMATRQVMAH
jgi:hypothetical protein